MLRSGKSSLTVSVQSFRQKHIWEETEGEIFIRYFENSFFTFKLLTKVSHIETKFVEENLSMSGLINGELFTEKFVRIKQA